MLDPAVEEGGQLRRGRCGQPDRRVRRGVLQPADLAQRRPRRDRRVVPGRGAGRPRGGGPDRDDRAPGARLRRRRHVVRGRELPSLRASRAAPRDGMGEAGRRGHPGRSAAGGSARGRAAGAGADRAARLHVSRAEGLAVRRVARAPDVSRAVGGRAGAAGRPSDSDLWAWLRALYTAPAPAADRFDSYLHEAGAEPPSRPRTRADLSWWSLIEMAPALGGGGVPWRPGNTLLESQGLAILRREDRYASLECGAYGGGHGHPDRLHLTLHAHGHHWLPDPGTGSYVARDLFWYRSTLAHNAPRLDGVSQPAGDAECRAFGESGDWAWARGGYDDFTRTLVAGPRYLLDILEFSAPEEHVVELPWHPHGDVQVVSPGRWEPEGGAGRVRSHDRAIRSRGRWCREAARRCGGRHQLHAAPRSRRRAAPRHGARPARLDRRCDVLPAARRGRGRPTGQRDRGRTERRLRSRRGARAATWWRWRPRPGPIVT